MGDRTAKSRHQEVRVTESKFEDDVAVYICLNACTKEMMEQVVGELICQDCSGLGPHMQ